DSNGMKLYAENQSFTAVFVIIAAFMLVSVIIMTLTVKENRLPHVAADDGEETDRAEKKPLEKSVKKSLIMLLVSVFLWFAAYNAVTTAFSRYCYEIWHVDMGKSSGYLLFATVAAIVAFLPLGFLSNRFGRKKTVLIGIALMTVCFAVAATLTKETAIMYAVFALVGVGWAAINVNSYPMAVEISSGSDIGKYTGLYYTFSMAAQIATPLISGLIISNTSVGYKTLFPYAVVFAALSFVTMCFVRHGDSKPELAGAMLENLSGGDE
ncbi:MAG: MFS transporter, partial [Clostridia bacterium]|nr:MFS transporter [Clostridia bacterium]